MTKAIAKTATQQETVTASRSLDFKAKTNTGVVNQIAVPVNGKMIEKGFNVTLGKPVRNARRFSGM